MNHQGPLRKKYTDFKIYGIAATLWLDVRHCANIVVRCKVLCQHYQMIQVKRRKYAGLAVGVISVNSNVGL